MSKSNTKVICISGKARHGKDTTANFLKEYLEAAGKKVLIAHYGDQVKYICRTFFGWNGEKDEAGRTLLQRIGTDVIRKQNPRHWVDRVLEILHYFPDEWDYVLIPDCRFPDEVERVKESGFDCFHVRVIRPYFDSPLTAEQQAHPSETALDHYMADYFLVNQHTLDTLKKYVGDLADKILGRSAPVASSTRREGARAMRKGDPVYRLGLQKWTSHHKYLSFEESCKTFATLWDLGLVDVRVMSEDGEKPHKVIVVVRDFVETNVI